MEHHLYQEGQRTLMITDFNRQTQRQTLRQDGSILRVKRRRWSLGGILLANFMPEYIGCVCMLHSMASLSH